MTLTLDLRPEVQAELARQAELAGSALETYAAGLLEDAAGQPPDREVPDGREQRFGIELVEACARVRGLLTDEEIDTLFSREPSTDRPLDLS